MIPTEHAECTENITRRRFSEFCEFRGSRNDPHRTRRMHRKYYKKRFCEFCEFRGSRNDPHRTRRMHRKYYKKKIL